MDGIVACETLYPELPRVAPEAEVAYVPQWYHEFPIHTPESDRAHRILQERIDELEARDLDQIVVIYHDPDALEGLRTDRVPLHVYRGRDCIELHLDTEPSGPGGERKAGGAYYLTRGWIDVGVDSYKVYRAYDGSLEDLRERFEIAAGSIPAMRVSWPKSEMLQRAAARSETMRTDPAELLEKIIGSYRNVVLIDTGVLHPFHHEYAGWFQTFLAGLGSDGSDGSVTLEVVDGTLEHLRSVLTTPEAVSTVETVGPGTSVPAEPGYRTGPQHG